MKLEEGCFCVFSINFYTYETDGEIKLGCGFSHVRFMSYGESLSFFGGGKAEGFDNEEVTDLFDDMDGFDSDSVGDVPVLAGKDEDEEYAEDDDDEYEDDDHELSDFEDEEEEEVPPPPKKKTGKKKLKKKEDDPFAGF